MPLKLEIRDTKIEGIGPWVWRSGDYWAWKHPLKEFSALRDLILKHAKARRVIVQAGGCMGMYPRLWAEQFERVYTFEPDWQNFACLTANCGKDNIIKAQMALANEAGHIFFRPGHECNRGLGKIEEDGPETVLSIPLDALDLPTVDVIQLDCEGSEHNVIIGACETIGRCRPVIAVERPSASLESLLADLRYAVVGCCGSTPDVVFAPLP